MDKLAAYHKLNNTFQKKYIFNFGSEGGFYSEFNNMVFAMVYCLKYRYQFILYSGNSKFKTQKGWEDFFEPFCESVNSQFHKKFNKRLTAKKIKPKHYFQWYLFKIFNKDTFLTYELFSLFYNGVFEKESFDFPELGLKGNLRDVSRELVKMIYRFNTDTGKEVQQIITTLSLPPEYTSLNIRRGDKDTEFNFVPASSYVEKLMELSAIKDVFILTDDYTVIEELEKQYPGIHFYTLVNKEERGYVHTDFINASESKKKDDLVKLFASIEIMSTSGLAIGTYTTNPGLFLGMYMPEDKFISIQKASWYQFEKDDVKTFIANPNA
jgi:hypothetical protein